MSKLALINRQYKREKLVAKYAKRRAAAKGVRGGEYRRS